MRNIEFFNFLPEEVEVLRVRFTTPGRSIPEAGDITEWGESIVRRNENLALLKIRNAMHNCGISMTDDNIRMALSQGIIKLVGIVENNF